MVQEIKYVDHQQRCTAVNQTLETGKEDEYLEEKVTNELLLRLVIVCNNETFPDDGYNKF